MILLVIQGLHPNEAGYKLMSGIAEKIILQATS